MKLSKDDLKEIVKECLVELLSEGLSSRKNIAESRSVRSVPASQVRSSNAQLSGRAASPAAQQQRSSMYDKMSFIPQKDQVERSASAQKKVNPLSMVKDITSDPVLAGVLAETAASGQHLNMNESSTNAQPSHESQVMSSGDAAARKMLMSDPTELFGESANMWSTLAFSSPGRK